jgi:GATA-binding protein
LLFHGHLYSAATFLRVRLAGLYFKLHGTHRPNSMKKTVIKRRKRVPAAAGSVSGSSGRMSDQAAAEALVAVARLGVGNGTAQVGDESEGEVEPPKRKRARRGKSDKSKSASRKDRGGEDGMEGIDDNLDARDSHGRPLKRSMNGSWGDDARSPGKGMHHAGSSPPARAQSVPRPDMAGLDPRYVPHAHLQRGFGSPHPHGGFDLPPLNAALGGGETASGVAGPGGRGYGVYGFSGTPSSYIRSSSSAPSRTHSPLGPAGMGAGSYLLPLPHMQGLPHPYYSSPSQPSPMSGLHGPPSPPSNEAMVVGSMVPGVPTMGELERHYFELQDYRKRLEEMVEKTDRLMMGVKRGIDEMKGGTGQEDPQPSTPSVIQGAVAVPLRASTGSSPERERTKENVWPVVEPPAND